MKLISFYTVRLKGFVLVEISIALLVLGIVTSITMTQLTVLSKLRQEQVTHDNMEFVVKALSAYYLNKNGLLPFPNETSLNIGENYGTIPWQKLGIMKKYSNDGHGQPLLYKVNPVFCGYGYKTNKEEMIFEVKNDRFMFEIKTMDSKQKVLYSENVFVQVHCRGRTFRMQPSFPSTGDKF